jgi:hypothetical protein
MASVLTNWWGNSILAILSSKGAWVSLHEDDPTVLADPGTEVAGGGYLRQQASFSTASSKTVATTNQLIFAAMPAITLTYIGLNTASVGGNMYCSIAIPTPILVGDSSHIVLAAGDIAVTL